jgi:hypothetical protein
MPSMVVHMSKKEFAQVVSTAVEQKLVELFGDPDDGLVLKDGLRKRLVPSARPWQKVNAAMISMQSANVSDHSPCIPSASSNPPSKTSVVWQY